METSEIGFGGSCHWCTEAIFLSLKGVIQVKQGWIASTDRLDQFSEAVIVRFEPARISLKTLIAIHLHSHSSTSTHSMRGKYRSAIYTFSDQQQSDAIVIIHELQKHIKEAIITEVVAFSAFKLNKTEYLNYYYANPQKPFCQNIVNPKLIQLLHEFTNEVDTEKLTHLLPVAPKEQ